MTPNNSNTNPSSTSTSSYHQLPHDVILDLSLSTTSPSLVAATTPATTTTTMRQHSHSQQSSISSLGSVSSSHSLISVNQHHHHYHHNHHHSSSSTAQLLNGQLSPATSATSLSSVVCAPNAGAQAAATAATPRVSMNRLSGTYCCFRLRTRAVDVCGQRAAVLPLLAVCALVAVYWFGARYLNAMLLWIETQNGWLTFAVFMCFFTVVSFPVVVGYLILIITSGYLFGCVKGLLTVVVGANVGVAIAHQTIRALHGRLPIQR